jgi:hypothetical protein
LLAAVLLVCPAQPRRGIARSQWCPPGKWSLAEAREWVEFVDAASLRG